MTYRLHLDLVIVRSIVIGRVHQLPPLDDSPKGGIRPSAPWQAYGMQRDWDDTDLGKDHVTQSAARKAITDWYEKTRSQTEEKTATISGVRVSDKTYEGFTHGSKGSPKLELLFPNGVTRYFQPDDGKEIK